MTVIDEQPARPVPYDHAAEAWVIGARLVTRYPRPDLEAEDFYVPAHQALWAHLDLIPTGPDREMGDPIRRADIPERLRPTAEACDAACAGNPAHHARIVRDCARARVALAAADQLAAAARVVDIDQAYDVVSRLALALSA